MKGRGRNQVAVVTIGVGPRWDVRVRSNWTARLSPPGHQNWNKPLPPSFHLPAPSWADRRRHALPHRGVSTKTPRSLFCGAVLSGRGKWANERITNQDTPPYPWNATASILIMCSMAACPRRALLRAQTALGVYERLRAALADGSQTTQIWRKTV